MCKLFFTYLVAIATLFTTLKTANTISVDKSSNESSRKLADLNSTSKSEESKDSNIKPETYSFLEESNLEKSIEGKSNPDFKDIAKRCIHPVTKQIYRCHGFIIQPQLNFYPYQLNARKVNKYDSQYSNFRAFPKIDRFNGYFDYKEPHFNTLLPSDTKRLPENLLRNKLSRKESEFEINDSINNGRFEISPDTISFKVEKNLINDRNRYKNICKCPQEKCDEFSNRPSGPINFLGINFPSISSSNSDILNSNRRTNYLSPTYNPLYYFPNVQGQKKIGLSFFHPKPLAHYPGFIQPHYLFKYPYTVLPGLENFYTFKPNANFQNIIGSANNKFNFSECVRLYGPDFCISSFPTQKDDSLLPVFKDLVNRPAENREVADPCKNDGHLDNDCEVEEYSLKLKVQNSGETVQYDSKESIDKALKLSDNVRQKTWSNLAPENESEGILGSGIFAESQSGNLPGQFENLAGQSEDSLLQSGNLLHPSSLDKSSNNANYQEETTLESGDYESREILRNSPVVLFPEISLELKEKARNPVLERISSESPSDLGTAYAIETQKSQEMTKDTACFSENSQYTFPNEEESLKDQLSAVEQNEVVTSPDESEAEREGKILDDIQQNLRTLESPILLKTDKFQETLETPSIFNSNQIHLAQNSFPSSLGVEKTTSESSDELQEEDLDKGLRKDLPVTERIFEQSVDSQSVSTDQSNSEEKSVAAKFQKEITDHEMNTVNEVPPSLRNYEVGAAIAVTSSKLNPKISTPSASEDLKKGFKDLCKGSCMKHCQNLVEYLKKNEKDNFDYQSEGQASPAPSKKFETGAAKAVMLPSKSRPLMTQPSIEFDDSSETSSKSDEEIEKMPIKYYSPADRILDYKKKHQNQYYLTTEQNIGYDSIQKKGLDKSGSNSGFSSSKSVITEPNLIIQPGGTQSNENECLLGKVEGSKDESRSSVKNLGCFEDYEGSGSANEDCNFHLEESVGVPVPDGRVGYKFETTMAKDENTDNQYSEAAFTESSRSQQEENYNSHAILENKQLARLSKNEMRSKTESKGEKSFQKVSDQGINETNEDVGSSGSKIKFGFDKSQNKIPDLATNKILDLTTGKILDLRTGKNLDLTTGKNLDVTIGKTLDLTEDRTVDLMTNKNINRNLQIVESGSKPDFMTSKNFHETTNKNSSENGQTLGQSRTEINSVVDRNLHEQQNQINKKIKVNEYQNVAFRDINSSSYEKGIKESLKFLSRSEADRNDRTDYYKEYRNRDKTIEDSLCSPGLMCTSKSVITDSNDKYNDDKYKDYKYNHDKNMGIVDSRNYVYLGRLLPENSGNSEFVYVGEGTKFPLKLIKLSDGSFSLMLSKMICDSSFHNSCPCCAPQNRPGINKRNG